MSAGERVPFGGLERGARFAVGQGGLEDEALLNMKVEPAVLCDCPGPPIPFNAVNLGDGRVRTFSDSELVWVKEREGGVR